MFLNNSPWLKQLNRTRPVDFLTTDITTDIIIVGGGIAGIVTAYYILKYTDKKVVLIESNKIAHGATGHNAGQITSYFEKSLKVMIEEFGAEGAVAAQRVIEEDARVLLDDIFVETGLKTPMSQFLGYEGLTTLEQVNADIEENLYRAQYNLPTREILISENFEFKDALLPTGRAHYTFVPQEVILQVLETTDSNYIAAMPFLSGCMNSALFTEELAGYLLLKHRDRFSLYEQTHIEVALLKKDTTVLKTRSGNSITSEMTVLATNGFEHIALINEAGIDIDPSFHHHLMGKIGFMAGYLEDPKYAPTALIYMRKAPTEEEPYIYVTRRPYEKDEKGRDHSIVCIGGPEYFLESKKEYDPLMHYPDKIGQELDSFIHDTFKVPRKIPYAFHWHGLMGYTKTGVRLIGKELCNPRLIYNLGCNGVGILPSIYGGDRVAKIIRGDTLPPTIFDPADQTCPR